MSLRFLIFIAYHLSLMRAQDHWTCPSSLVGQIENDRMGTGRGFLCNNTDRVSNVTNGNWDGCIGADSVCNGIDDCGDNSDEMINCDAFCSSIHGFFCNNTGNICLRFVLPFMVFFAITLAMYGDSNDASVSDTVTTNRIRCDGVNDCVDGQDEENCDQYCEYLDWFFCGGTDTNCIHPEFLCDDEVQCKDGSDEPSGLIDRNHTGYSCAYQGTKLNTAGLICGLKHSTERSAMFFYHISSLTQVLKSVEYLEESGIGFSNPIAHASFLFINVITAIFVMIGLHLYE
eukprot:471458_1